MEGDRRDFLSTLAAGAVGAAGLAATDWSTLPAQQAAGHWDLSWVSRLKGRYRAVFDIPVIEDGYGVWRAAIWRKQYSQVFGVPESSLTTVVNIRHDAIALVLRQEYWDRYDVGTRWEVHDPASRRPTTRNPVIGRTGAHALPEQFADFTLESLMAGGAIVLACALALRDCSTLVAEREQVSMDVAEERVRGMLAPGVILQPSGVFAAVLAQDNGCRFVRAS